MEEYDRQLALCDMVCVSGSLPKGVSVSFYVELVRRAKAQNKRIIVDTSGSTLMDVIHAAPFMVKPNRDEVAQMLGRTLNCDADIAQALQLLKAKGVDVPLVTLGAQGAAALIEGRLYRFCPPPVTVKNAVGSGDSMVAGIATGLCRGLPILNAIHFGVAAGTANTQFMQTGMVNEALVEKYYGETGCFLQ